MVNLCVIYTLLACTDERRWKGYPLVILNEIVEEGLLGGDRLGHMALSFGDV